MAQSLSALVECTICLEQFKQPKGLPCQHTYCLGCLEGVVNDGFLNCPQCRGRHAVPEGDCKCDTSKTAECDHCKEQLCAECLVTHRKLSSEIRIDIKNIRATESESQAWEKFLANIAEEKGNLPVFFDEMVAKIRAKEKECITFLDGLENSLCTLRDSDENVAIEGCKTSQDLRRMNELMCNITKLRESVNNNEDLDFKLVYNDVNLANLVEAQCGEKRFKIDKDDGSQAADLPKRFCHEHDEVEGDKTVLDIAKVDARGLFSVGLPPKVPSPSGPRNVDYKGKNPDWEYIHNNDGYGGKPSCVVFWREFDQMFCLFNGSKICSRSMEDKEWKKQVLHSESSEFLHFTISESGKLIIANGKGFVIQDLMAEVQLSRKIEIPDKFKNITQVCSYGREFTLLDSERKCLMTFNENGDFIREFGSDELKDSNSPFFMCADRQGRIYVLVNQISIEIFSWNGEKIKGFKLFGNERIVGGICVDEDQFLSVSKKQLDAIHVYDLNLGERRLHCQIGDAENRPGEFNAPEGLCLMPNGRMIVCDTGKKRLLIL